MTEFYFNELLYPLLVVSLIFLIPYIFFLLSQYNILKVIQPDNRLMQPFEVWFQLVPVFGLIWQFVVVGRIADSIRNEYQSQKDISFLGMGDGELLENINNRVTYSTGFWYCVMVCCSLIPILGFITGIGALALWITYWRQLIKHKEIIQQSNLG
jgi:hypothetical protein